MKIGVNTLFMIPGEVGGTETYLRRTLEAIAEGFPSHQLVMFTNAENDAVLRKDFARYGQVSYVPLRFCAANRPLRIVKEQLSLPNAVKTSGVDVLWSPGYTAPYSCACPQVVTIPDMQYKSHPEDFTFSYLVATSLLVRMSAARARRIIAISHFSKAEIVKYTGQPPEKIEVTHLGGDKVFGIKADSAVSEAVLNKFEIGHEPYILCVANTYPHKNVHVLAGAFTQISRQYPHRLVLVGRPRLGEQSLRETLAGLKDASRVTRLEYVDQAELAALYQHCSAFVFPSVYEGFGIPVVEAMLAGVPVIAANMGSIPEVGGDNVRYFRGGDSGDLAGRIGEVLSMDRPSGEKVIKKAAEWAQRFTWKATAERTIACLESALACK